jgi:hypothetical protein
MVVDGNLYINEYGHSLFEQVLTVYDRWLEGIPYVSGGDDVTESQTHRMLVRDVWPAVQQLCIRLEAADKGELAARIEGAYRDAEDYARIIDDYCRSDKFDYNLWQFGDLAMDSMQYEKERDPTVLSAKAEVIGNQSVTDFDAWCYRCQWVRELGEKSEQIEIEKYGHAPFDDYAQVVARWAWACFWLAAQLRYHKVDHHQARAHLEKLLASLCFVSETKDPIVDESLGRAYGMRIHPFAPLESQEISASLEGLITVVAETRKVLVTAQDKSDASSDKVPALVDTPDTSVTLNEFLQQYCLGGDRISKNSLLSRRRSIQNAAHAGTIQLPQHVGQWKTGKPKYYRPDDLAEQWNAYCKALPNLPPLKAGNPSSGGQSA